MSLLRKKRIFYTLISFATVFCLLAARVAWIQSVSAYRPVTAGGRTINELAVRQREEGIELDSGRGHFTDRNGVSLTGDMAWSPILFPIKNLPDTRSLSQVASLLGTTAEKLKLKWNNLKSAYVWPDKNGTGPLQLTEEEAKRWPSVEGFEVLPYMSRYRKGTTGMQWLGYVAERPDVIRNIHHPNGQHYRLPLTLQVGAAGLERSFDPFLRGIGGDRAYLTIDARKRPLQGFGTRVDTANNRYYPLQITTTVDSHIQQDIEQLAKEMSVGEGAIVVLDAASGDVVSMVSLPFYQPQHIDLKGGSWSNRAVKAAVPGSIFKTVIAAAALENKITFPGEHFYCSGEYSKYGLSCWKKGGHGDITLEEGFAESCNIVFATLGERLSAADIAETASKLGLGRTVGWRDSEFLGVTDLKQMDQEEAGAIFSNLQQADGGVRAQTALGQRDVLVSPLQAANLVVTLLHGGQVMSPRLVREIKYKDGTSMAQLPVLTAPSPSGQISARTADRLLSWMRRVVTDGTGRELQRSVWNLAGKSGTAQVMKNGKPLNHQWFIGYGPAESPKYAAAVLVKNRPDGSPHQATELFRRTMDLLAAYEKTSVFKQ